MKIQLVMKTLWTEVKEFLRNTPTIGLTPLPEHNLIEACRLDKGYLSDVLTEHDFAEMRPETPMFIVSQTGSGKSTLVMDCCLPVAMRRKQKILYLASRNSLLSQMKMRAINDPVNAELQGDYIKVGQMGKEYNPKLMKACHNFGALEIYSYQEFLYRMDKMDFTRYAFVIIDEAHFFVSDATFNCFTEEILRQVIIKCKNVSRIYITATPEEVFDTICEKEKAIWPLGGPHRPKLEVFVSDEDYSHMKTTFLNNADELVQLILNVRKDQSWLIFVREKGMGRHLLEALSQIKDDVMFMTAEVDMQSKAYQEMVTEEKLPCRVLIATKVIDVGVNIRTENLHVAAFEDDPAELKQMIGRKRLKADEKLDLYIVVPAINELKRRLGLVEKELRNERALISNAQSEKDQSYYSNMPHPLYANTYGGVEFNDLSIRKLEIEQSRLKRLINKLEPYEKDWEVYKKMYAFELMTDFNGAAPGFSFEARNLKEEMQSHIDQLISEWWGLTLDETDRENFSKALAALVGDARKDQRDSRGCMKTNAINKALNKYGYGLKSLKTTPVTYQLEDYRNGGEDNEG